jgi:hypothetical protein
VVRAVILKSPTIKTRNSVVTFVASLLRGFPAGGQFADLLFRDTRALSDDSSNPFSYLFINLLLIDVRTTIPLLMETLGSSSYSTTTLRLAASYDIISSFIMYLLQNLGDDTDFKEGSQFSAILPPDLLLKLRRDFSETFSLTLEFFRDRWEATVTGVSGLDASARVDPDAPLAITWDNPSVAPSEDPILLAGLRALSLWLREDDNPQLHEQAIGIMDMLIPLYLSSAAPDSKIDFRHPILTAFLGIFPASENAVQSFLDQKGWKVLADDLEISFRLLGSYSLQPVPLHTHDLIRVFILIVESDAVPRSPNLWMEIVRQMANCTIPSVEDGQALETLVGGWQLVVALVMKAPTQIKKTIIQELRDIVTKARIISKEVGKLDPGTREGLTEVIDGLEDFI